MAFMAVAMIDSIGVVNPLLIIPSIAKVLKEYVLTVVMLGLILVLRWLMTNYLKSSCRPHCCPPSFPACWVFTC